MRIIKKLLLGIFIFLTAASLFTISAGIIKDLSGGFYAVCAIIFIVCAAAILLIFIIDREKPVLFAFLYPAAIICGILLPYIIL